MERARAGRSSPTATIFLAVLTAILVGGLILFGAWIVFMGGRPFGIEQPQPPVVQQPPPAVQQPQAPPGRLQLQVQDIDTAQALGGTSAKVDVIDPADLTKPRETITVDTTSKIGTSALLYTPGQRLLLHVYSTEGSGYYDQVYDVVVPSGYTLQANQYIYFLGAFGLKQRVSGANVAFTLFSGATVLSSATGATPDGSADLYSAPAKVIDLSLQINLQSYLASYGRPIDYINARFEKVQLRAVAWLAFNNTAISTSALTAQGWNLVSTTAVTGWVVFYRILDPVESTQTSLGSASIPIRFDATSIPTGKRVLVYIWVADLQNPADAAAGVGWSTLTAYGAHSGYGVTSALGRTFQASGGSPTGPLLQANIAVP